MDGCLQNVLAGNLTSMCAVHDFKQYACNVSIPYCRCIRALRSISHYSTWSCILAVRYSTVYGTACCVVFCGIHVPHDDVICSMDQVCVRACVRVRVRVWGGGIVTGQNQPLRAVWCKTRLLNSGGQFDQTGNLFGCAIPAQGLC